MAIHFETNTFIQADPETIFDAWLDSTKHAEMTGGGAEVSAVIGGKFTAWDEYISGMNLELSRPNRIVQAWRTVEFEDHEPDSRLEIIFQPETGGTRITLRHFGLPAHGMQYEQGWIDNYFDPMKDYFEG